MENQKENIVNSVLPNSFREVSLKGNDKQFLIVKATAVYSKDLNCLCVEKPVLILTRGYVADSGQRNSDKWDKIQLPENLKPEDFKELEKVYFEVQKASEKNFEAWKEKNKSIKGYVPKDKRKKQFDELKGD